MTSSPTNSVAFQVPENVSFSKDYNQFILQLTDLYIKLSKASNSKDVGTYELTEIVNGQKYYGATPQVTRTVYRKCFRFGAIASGATLNIPHGITFVEFTRIYGTCTTCIVDYRPIPFSSILLTSDQIQLLVAGANIVIINGATAPDITNGNIVLEYVRSW